jgi:hypothetical protein
LEVACLQTAALYALAVSQYTHVTQQDCPHCAVSGPPPTLLASAFTFLRVCQSSNTFFQCERQREVSLRTREAHSNRARGLITRAREASQGGEEAARKEGGSWGVAAAGLRAREGWHLLPHSFSTSDDGSPTGPTQARLRAAFGGEPSCSASGTSSTAVGCRAAALAAALLSCAFSAVSALRTSLVHAPRPGCCSRSLASSGLRPRSGSATRSSRTASRTRAFEVAFALDIASACYLPCSEARRGESGTPPDTV